LVLTKSILSSNRAFALIQSILSRFLRKVGRVVGHIMIGTVKELGDWKAQAKPSQPQNAF